MHFHSSSSHIPDPGEPHPQDHFARFDPADVYDRHGVQVAFLTKRTGDELVFHAIVQNGWTAQRRVRFRVSPERERGRGNLPQGEAEASLEAGEVGSFEVVLPIPDDTWGLHRCYVSLQVVGSEGTLWLRTPRRSFSERIPTKVSVLMIFLTLGGAMVSGGGLSIDHQIEAPDRVRIPGPIVGRYTRTRIPDRPLVAAPPPKLTPTTLSRSSKFMLAGLMSLMFITSIAMLWVTGYPTVYVVNGLDSPVAVTIGSKRFDVPERSHRRTHLGLGTYEGVAVDDNGEVDRVQIRSSPPRGTIVWNVAGVAPVFREEIVYSSTATPRAPKLYCGQSVIEFYAFVVNDAFTDPPRSAEKGSRRTLVHVYDMGKPANRCLD